MDVLWMHVRLGMQMLKVVSRDWLPRRRSLSDPQESVAHAAFDSER
jgi:hypothetical protein